jgi:alpha-tubulin suppressor-like RCC1 family protein
MSGTPIFRRLALAAAAVACAVLGLASAGGAASSTPTLVVWGDNSSDQLSYTSPARSVIPTPVQGGNVKCTTANLGLASAVGGGGNHSLALIKSGFVCGWGHSFYGQLGRGVFFGSPINVPAPVCRPTSAVSGACINPANQFLQGATAIGGGGFHSMALLGTGNNLGLAAGTVVTWGQNNNGELGTGTVANSAAPVAVCLGPIPCGAGGPFLSGVTAISAGLYFNLALLGPNNSMGLPPGSVVSWGDNTYGELGIGNNTASPNTCTPGPSSSTYCSQYPHQVMGIDKGCGGVPNSTGSIGPGPLFGVTAISAGQSQSLALVRGGNVCSWGDNAFGQLGIKNDGTVTTSPDGCVNNFLSTVRSCGWYAHMVRAPTYAQDCPSGGSSFLSGVTAISAGFFHNLALVNNSPGGGTVCSWGRNSAGELGIGPVSPDSCSGSTACSDEPIAVWGVGGLGLLGGVTAISAGGAGGAHSLAVVNPPYGAVGQVVAWGDNPNGELGIGTTTPSNTPALVCAPGPITVGPVACSGYLTGVTRGLDAAVNTFSLALQN